MLKSLAHKLPTGFSEALIIIESWRAEDTKIVFTNGCFDLLHLGHLYLLSEAKKLGSRLIVGLNSDQSIQIIKGFSRPIKPENQRAYMLAAIKFVDLVILFDQETPRLLIEAIKPDFLVKGGDWPKEDIVGAKFVESYGAQVVQIPYLKGYSTSDFVKKILNSEINRSHENY